MAYLLSVTEIQQERAELLARAEALAELAKTEDRELTEDEQNEFDRCVVKHRDMEKDEERAQYIADQVQKKTQPRLPVGEPPLTGDDDPPKRKIPATAKRTRVSKFAGTVEGRSAEERAYRLGMWALSKVSKDMPRRFKFPEAQRWVDEEIFAASMGEGGADTSGGDVFVPEEFTTDIIRLRESYGVADRVLRTTSMAYETKTIPRWRTAMTVYWRGENTAGTESNPAYDDIELHARSLTALSRMSRELSADAAISLGDELAGEAAYAMAEKEDQAAFNGTGTNAFGGQQGIRIALGALTAGTAPGLPAGAGTTWASLTLANLRSVVAALPQYADTPAATWICHRTFYYDVLLGLILAAGGSESREVTDPGVRARPMFLGYPVTFSQVYPSATAVSQVPITLGDHGQGAVIGRRSGMEVSFSEEATVGGESLWERNQIGVRTLERLHINVHDVGSNTVAGPICGVETTAS